MGGRSRAGARARPPGCGAARGGGGWASPWRTRAASAACRPEGSAVLAGGGDGGRGAIRLWEAAPGAALHHQLEADGIAWQVALSPDGRSCAVASGGGNVGLWDLAAGKRLVELRGHQS